MNHHIQQLETTASIARSRVNAQTAKTPLRYKVAAQDKLNHAEERLSRARRDLAAFETGLLIGYHEAFAEGLGDDSADDAVSGWALVAAPAFMTIGELREAKGEALAQALRDIHGED